MKTEIKAITPEQAGLTLAVLSGPRGAVRGDSGMTEANVLNSAPKAAGWPCIEYTCQLSNARRQIVWTGEYRLGVGHVKSKPRPFLTQEEQGIADALNRGGGKWLCRLEMVADVAAKLAKTQKVMPHLNDVCHSLLMDGAAFFDGQRFEDWAADFGYSDDSIKAKETFETCDRIGRDLSRHFSRDELSGLREWAGNS